MIILDLFKVNWIDFFQIPEDVLELLVFLSDHIGICEGCLVANKIVVLFQIEQEVFSFEINFIIRVKFLLDDECHVTV